MRVLVTGANGFLGSHLVEAGVGAGDDVVAFVRPTSDARPLEGAPGVRILRGELTDPATLDAALRGVDVVYHCAARVSDHGTRRQFYEANVAATEALLQAARRARASRFVYVSSPSVVADGRDQLGIDESLPYPARYLNLYSETKAIAEQRVLRANGPDLVTCAIRPRAVWGPRDYKGFLPKLLAKMCAGTLRRLSAGRPVLTMVCHVENAARACLLAARSSHVGGKAYFVTDGETLELWSCLSRIATIFGVAPPSGSPPSWLVDAWARLAEWLWRMPGLGDRRSPPFSRYALTLLTKSSTYDISAARRDLRYEPRMTLDRGLGELARWVDSIGGLAAFTARVQGS